MIEYGHIITPSIALSNFSLNPACRAFIGLAVTCSCIMLVGNAIAGEMPSAHYMLSKMAQCDGMPSAKDSWTTNPLASFKSLVHCALRITTSTKPLIFKPLYDAGTVTSPRQAFSLTRHAMNPPSVFICVSSVFLKGVNGDNAGFNLKHDITLLIIYTVSKLGDICLVGSLYFYNSYQTLEKSPRRVTFDTATTKFTSHPHQRAFSTILYFLAASSFLNGLNFGGRTPVFLHFRRSQPLDSLFSFLRYSGPKRLQRSRKILLDEDGYQITHIGQGAFAVISRVLHRPSGEVRVMKRITFDKTGLAKYLAKNEVDALKAMSGNPWFPPLLNHFKDGDEYLVTMPFYRRGDLSGLVEHKGYLGRELARFYSAQLILAIHSLHKVGIVHRDIKTDNIFLDEQGHLVLADLGLAENIATYEGGEEMMRFFPEWLEARDKGGDDFPFLWVNHRNPLGMTGSAGTFWYTAPEVFRKERYSFGVDYWSVGVIYYELITGHIPFNHYKPYPENKRPELDFRVKPGQLKDIAHWEEEALTEFLNPHPAYRPRTLTEIKQSPIFDGVWVLDFVPHSPSIQLILDKRSDWGKMRRREITPPFLPQPLREG